MVRKLYSKFLLVIAPTFVALLAFGLFGFVSYDLYDQRSTLTARIGNLAPRVSGALVRHDAAAHPDLAQDLVAPLAADRAILCAEFRVGNGRKLVAAVPPGLGCKGVSGGYEIAPLVGESAQDTLVIRFTDNEVTEAARIRASLTAWIVVIAFIVTILSASLGFRVIVGRPLNRLLTSIQRATDGGERVPVVVNSHDELGAIIHAYNDMIARDAERETSLKCANDELRRSQHQLRQLNDSLEERISERTKDLEDAKTRAETASEAKSRFLATISHEIRTPLNGVLGMTELLLETRLEPKQRRYAQTIRTSGSALLGVINDVLDYSQIEAGKLELCEQAFAPRQLVRELIEMFAPVTAAKGIELQTHIPDDVPDTVRSDPLRLRQILTNIIGNAIKFTEQGAVSVQVTTEGGGNSNSRLRFEVRDTGIGLEPAVQSKIFDAFTQVDSSMTRRHGGTGLGLAISRQLVRLLQGEIGVHSILGTGSTFWFTVKTTPDISLRPLSPAACAMPADSAADPHSETTPVRRVANPLEHIDAPDVEHAETPILKQPLFRGDVLLAEDDEVNAEIAQAMLESLGMHVTRASDGKQAVEHCRSRQYDLVLMDGQMPVMNGLDATRAIREMEVKTGARQTVVAFTAHAFEEYLSECESAGMDDFMTKPFTSSDLARVLGRWLPPCAAAPA